MYDLKMMNELGLKKITMAKEEKLHFLWRAILAGFFLGVAMILSYSLAALFKDNATVSKIMIAFTFGIGLVCISLFKAELFTGNCLLTMIPVFSKEAKLRDLSASWIICYIGNIIGVGLIGVLFIYSQMDTTLMKEYLAPVCETKLTFSIMPLFIKAILCNFVVCIASFAGIKLKHEFTKVIMLMLLVATFVIAGLEHCIANWGLFSMNLAQYGFQFDWSQFPLHMILSTIGNIIGGSLLLGYPLYQVMKHEKRS